MRIRLTLQLDIRRRDRERPDEPGTEHVPAAATERADWHPVGFTIPQPGYFPPSEMEGSRA